MPSNRVINKLCEHEFDRGVVAGFWTGIAFILVLYYVVIKIQNKLIYHNLI